jgi:hypothetical protein
VILSPTVRTSGCAVVTCLRCLSAIAQLLSAGCAICAMAQMKPTISRADGHRDHQRQRDATHRLLCQRLVPSTSSAAIRRSAASTDRAALRRY